MDLLDEDGPVRPLRPVTIKWRRHQLKLAASAAVLAGVDAATITCLQELLFPDRFKLILRHLLDRYGKPTGFIYGLATALKSIARHHCKFDEDELDRLRALCRRFRVKQKGLSKKNWNRLRPFLHPDTRDRLLLLPQKLMAEAVRQPVSRKAALLAQLAVVLEIGEMAPLRAANLAALEVGKTIHFFGDGRRAWAVISLPEEMVKNEIALEYPLTPESTRLIKTYLDKFRPHLGGSSAFLFPGRNSGSKRPATLGQQVSRAISKHVGHRVHIHLLRHFAAMIYLQAYPGAYEAVRRLLGHATASAALDLYVGLEAHAAVRQFDQTVLKLRRQAQVFGGIGLRRKRR